MKLLAPRFGLFMLFSTCFHILNIRSRWVGYAHQVFKISKPVNYKSIGFVLSEVNSIHTYFYKYEIEGNCLHF